MLSIVVDWISTEFDDLIPLPVDWIMKGMCEEATLNVGDFGVVQAADIACEVK